MNKKIPFFAVFSMLSFSVFSADIGAGKSLSASCVGCHGSAGISANPAWPNLAGQKDQYLANQLKAFRDGRRTSDFMAPIAKGLSDDEIDNLSAYFSNLSR